MPLTCLGFFLSPRPTGAVRRGEAPEDGLFGRVRSERRVQDELRAIRRLPAWPLRASRCGFEPVLLRQHAPGKGDLVRAKTTPVRSPSAGPVGSLLVGRCPFSCHDPAHRCEELQSEWRFESSAASAWSAMRREITPMRSNRPKGTASYTRSSAGLASSTSRPVKSLAAIALRSSSSRSLVLQRSSA